MFESVLEFSDVAWPGLGFEYSADFGIRNGRLLALDRLRLASDAALEYLVGGPDSPGVFAQAGAGTVFIPDLHDVAPEAQSLLSAILAAGAYTPRGSTEPVALSCRIIAGLAEEPDAAIAAGRLDPTLHLQVSVLPLHVPPLRERREDVPDLVSYHADRLSNSEGLAYRPFSISALNRLRNHDWPGNEQELINLVQRLLVLGGEGEVDVQEVEEALQQPGSRGTPDPQVRPVSFDLPLREAREAFERDYLTYQLRKAGGSVGKLSEAVGMERTHLYRKLRSLGIDPKKVVGET